MNLQYSYLSRRISQIIHSFPTNNNNYNLRLTSSFSPNRRVHSDESDGGSSAVYRNARKYARPATVTWSERLHNSVSFIGTVEYPVKKIATKNGHFGVHTVLRVKSSPDSHSFFRILLMMWDEMAERALQHLKPNDYIYVSGELGSYTKSALQGIEKMKYKVIAKDLNYVKQGEPVENLQEVVNSESQHGRSSLEKYSRLHLWQVFFANPNEWYDLRKTKKTSKHPDFKHRSTGEALWLNAKDPPWIRKQLEMLDSRLSGGPPDDLAGKSMSSWTSDEEMLKPDPYQGQNTWPTM